MIKEMGSSKAKLSYLVLFIAGFAFVPGFRAWQAAREGNPKTSTDRERYQAEPPVLSIRGRVASISGKAIRHTREGKNEEQTDINTEILQGSSLTTENGARVTVVFDGFVILTVLENTKINFISTMSNNFLLQQQAGEVEYQLEEKAATASVRILHTLISLEKGNLKTAIDGRNIEITLPEGKVKVALVDRGNNTLVWKLESGQKAVINDRARDIEILDLPAI